MDDELTPEQKFAAEDAETLVPRALILGKKPEDVVADLVKLDWSLPAATAFVDRVVADMRQFRESPQSRQRLIDNAFRQFVVGGLFALVGIGVGAIPIMVMLGTGMIAIGLLGTGFFAFSAGLVTSGRGWARWRLYKRWSQSLQELEDRSKDQPS